MTQAPKPLPQRMRSRRSGPSASNRRVVLLCPVLLVAVIHELQSVLQTLDLLLRLSDLGVELVTLALELLPFLGCLDDIVGLRMLLLALLWRKLGHEDLISALQLLDLADSLAQLGIGTVALLLNVLGPQSQHVLVDVDFLLSLLECQLELHLAVFEGKDLVGADVEEPTQLAQLQPEDVFFDHQLLLFRGLGC
ncbi:uncharacterized protein BJ171DRAFT_29486 [Polychytrium aggregatum]|uniref:uncharacterized protein n=1 Tax=Polychytrium aggregatum TaxID=110093 RepID=UPI0022FDDD87|nr:uncharacterized protein BJ171DRAFT_29486 [Polychytrium aggregatum]KAI9206386.1 hypothetical protein BJ171DRAFT_29486 [Polychytrium aggregatum]